jgi:hypothetical protein
VSAEAFAWRGRNLVWFIPFWALFTALAAHRFITEPDWKTGFFFVGYTSVLVLHLISWRRRKRPALEIDEEEIRYAPSPLARQRRLPLREIDGIQISRWRKATLQLHSGRKMIVNLRRIEGIDRERAAHALERAVASSA